MGNDRTVIPPLGQFCARLPTRVVRQLDSSSPSVDDLITAPHRPRPRPRTGGDYSWGIDVRSRRSLPRLPEHLHGCGCIEADRMPARIRRVTEPARDSAPCGSVIPWSTSRYVLLPTPHGWPDRSQPGEKPREKGIDVALAIDFVTMAVRGEYDVGILFSTDTDLKPALEAVAQLGTGVRAEVAAWSGDGHNRRLSISSRQLWESRRLRSRRAPNRAGPPRYPAGARRASGRRCTAG